MEDQKQALKLDLEDGLSGFRRKFKIPKTSEGKECIYLAGNSLGLQPVRALEFVEQELEDWARLGVDGHLQARLPWLPYHENLTHQMARLVGAKPIEVVTMNTLSVNLNLMMVSFYRPHPRRFKILIEAGAFPSDQYAVASQIRFHGYDPKDALVELHPREGEKTLRNEDILNVIETSGKEIALILLGSVNYLTGQAFDIPSITQAGHAQGCQVGFDFAHGAGNLALKLHDWGPDFAVWCGYKYLNGGPGALSGCFVHERHSRSFDLPRFTGWWGHDKSTRFQMPSEYHPIPGAEGWQMSNPPILQLAALRASLEIFDEATMAKLRAKSVKITEYLISLLDQLPAGFCNLVTPRDPEQRGTQISLQFRGNPKELLAQLHSSGIICDFREPDIIRAAPAPLYVQYSDVYHFVKTLEHHANHYYT